MNKLKASSTDLAFCGIDVSAASLSVALIKPDQHLVQREFSNTAPGHRLLRAGLASAVRRCAFRWKPPGSTRWNWPGA